MRKTVISLVLGMACAFSMDARIEKGMLPDAGETAAMAAEADDFIDEISDGRQDRQADALLHAIRGMSGELAAVRQGRDVPYKPSAGVKAVDLKGDGSARGLSMRLYRPAEEKGAPLPLLVYFHGGGWSIGGINSCAAFCDSLASTGKVMVLAVDYSLAPEHPYPEGMMDCASAVEYAFSNARSWGSSPELISLGGDSAGGNLALSTALYRSAQKDVPGSIRSLVLFYPVVKAYRDSSASWKKYSRGYGLDGRLMEIFCEAYVGKGDVHDPMVSPAEGTDSVLSALPPMLVINAEKDILADQGKEFCSRAGKTKHIELPGTVHLFITVPGQPTAFRKAVELTAAYLE